MKATTLPRPASSDAPAPSNRETFFQRAVLSTFKGMNQGRLVLTLPSGEQREFGAARRFDVSELPMGIPSVARIQVLDQRFFSRCVLAGDIGFAESYLDGDWESPDLTAVIAWFILNIDDAPTLSGSARRKASEWIINLMRVSNRIGHLLRPNSRNSARKNIREHYDISNPFFELLLDPSMMYSSAIWESEDQTLAQAQETKRESLCRLLRLQPMDHVLEIGTGWGGWSIHAARKYGCRITTITNSKEHHDLARERVEAAGLSGQIEVVLGDYRELDGLYDKIVSIEMMEALGHRYLPGFCQILSKLLAPNGLLACQFITCPDSRYSQFRKGVDFIQKHIFPGSLLLSLNRVNEQLSQAGGFVLNHLSDHGQDYARTLREWRGNLVKNREGIEALGFDDRFFRKWSYYFNYCEAAFAMRNISVVQTLHTRPNNIELARVS